MAHAEDRPMDGYSTIQSDNPVFEPGKVNFMYTLLANS